MYWIPSYNKDTYQDEQKDWILKFIKYLNTSTQPNIWIDVGANKGEISKIIRQNTDQNDQIWLFEPSPDSYEFLCQTFKPFKNVKVWNCCLSNYTGTNDFFINKIDSMSGFNFLEKSIFSFNLDEYFTITSEVRTLDSFAVPTSYHIPLIKIDSEGQDFFILQGSSRILNDYRPYILFEFSGMLGSDTFNFTPTDMYSFFKKHRYTLKSIVGGYDERYIYSHYKVSNLGMFDLLAIPEEKPLD